MIGNVDKWLNELPPENCNEILLNVIRHLCKAKTQEKYEIAIELLLSFSFIKNKVVSFDPELAINDYNLVLNRKKDVRSEVHKSLQLIQEAIRLSAHIIGHDSIKLGQQLLGRLNESESVIIKKFLSQINFSEYWLKPLKTGLLKPTEIVFNTRTIQTQWNNLAFINALPAGLRSKSKNYCKMYRLVQANQVVIINYYTTEIRVYNVDTGEKVLSYSFKEDGYGRKILATACISDTNTIILSFQEHKYYLADGKVYNYTSVFDINTNKIILKFEQYNEDEIYILCPVKAQNTLLGFGNGIAFQFNLDDGKMIWREEVLRFIDGLSFALPYKGTMIFLITNTFTILWDFKSRTVVKDFLTASKMEGHLGQCIPLIDTQAFVPLFEKSQFISANKEKIILWDIVKAKETTSYDLQSGIPMISLNDGKRFITRKGVGIYIVNIEAKTIDIVEGITVGNPLQFLYLSKQHKLVCLQQNGLLRVCDFDD